MPFLRSPTLKENDDPLNQAALAMLEEAKAEMALECLHLLTLADWGLENGAEGDWPAEERYALEMQVGLLYGWEPANVMAWIVSNPNGPDEEEPEDDLLSSLESASSPVQAAAFVLNAIWAMRQP